MKTYQQPPTDAQVAQLPKNPYLLERVLGVVLWIAFFVVLFGVE